ncbi:sulfhydryl oxidase 1 [Rhinatrema bivittatum]|uniref:sulfhydryl oxidase 1 n=1 Tax=Rhinatrema bivittatum TaxID=194408 RepID=UPI0011282678|nr:sulfhydryl oxidase 1 [Rhinatrema bivittatum]
MAKPGCAAPSPPLLLVLVLVLLGPAAAGLYEPSDAVVQLQPDTVRAHLLNSNSAWFIEFYASWCGHCIGFAPTWKALARDIQDWRPVVYLAVMDCAESENVQTCSRMKVTMFPTVQFFKAFAQNPSDGIQVPVPPLDSPNIFATLREMIITYLEKHEDLWPPACPPLGPASAAEVWNFFRSNTEQYLALIFEEEDSYLGREVALDMVQYKNIEVRRVLSRNKELVAQYNVRSFPALYVLSRNGFSSHIPLPRNERSSYTHVLRTLPGVKRGLFRLAESPNADTSSQEPSKTWKPVDRSKVYMADLESAVHYTLRVEVSKFSTLEGERLTALRRYVTVLAKFFPARPYLKNLLQYMDDWLSRRTNAQISYSEFKDIVNNKEEVPQAVLMDGVNWVGCQGSKPWFRGFPCALWTLFHMLTVQAAYSAQNKLKETYPLEVLHAMRGYIQHFFGCTECAVHFEGMARETMNLVSTFNEAILWLWSRHNQVNYRLAGAPGEDPEFPKRQWPAYDMCPMCRSMNRRRNTWVENDTLNFLMTHFSTQNIATDYLVPEAELLQQRQRKKGGERRKKRETGEGRNIKEQEVMADSEEENAASENQRTEIATQGLERHRPSTNQRPPSIIWKNSQISDQSKDIVDLDSFVEQQYKSKALKAEASTVKRKLKSGRSETLVLTMEEDQQLDSNYAENRERLQKKETDSRYLIGVLLEEVGEHGEEGDSPVRRRWFRLLEVGLLRLDISLCIILYVFFSMCLLGMYMYFSKRTPYHKGHADVPTL